MNKLQYLDQLKKALIGLPPASQAKTLAWCEQRYVEGLAAGKSEDAISAELGDPDLLARTLRSSLNLATEARQPEPKKPQMRTLRTLGAGVGLLIFNLFMAIPAMVFGTLLATLYTVAFALYVSGIAVSASGLAGSDELVLKAPIANILIGDDEVANPRRTHISINENGIQVFNERDDEATPAIEANETAGEPARRRAEREVVLTTDLDEDARANQVVLGASLVLGGIVLFLLSIVATRYSIQGLRRYIKMNISILNGG